MEDNHTTTAADVIVAGHHSHSQSSGRTTAHTDTAAAAEKLRALEQTKIKPFLISVTVIAALGGMLFGWDIAASFRTIAFKDYFDLSCETNVTSSSFDDVVEVVEVEDVDESLLDDDGQHAHPMEAAHVCRNEASFVYLYELCAVVGAMVGCLLVGPWLFDTYGRRKTMFVGGACLLVAAIVASATMRYIEILYGMSILNGIGIGMLNMSCPAYIVEIAPIHRRGQLVTVWHMGVTVGITIVSICNIGLENAYYGWRLAFLGTIIISILFLGLLYIVPESPHYFMMQNLSDDNDDEHDDDDDDANGNSFNTNTNNRNVHFSNVDNEWDQKALDVLSKVRFTPQEIQWEYEELQKEVRLAKERRGQCCYICNNKNERIGTRLLYGIIIQAINQLSGINVFVVFTPIMMAQSFGTHGDLIGGFIMNITNLLVEFGVLLTVERLGRPMLLFVGAECMFVALCMIIWIESVIDQQRPGPSDVIMFCFMSFVYQVGFSFSWGPISWVYCAEVFDITTRGRGNGVTTFTNYFLTKMVAIGLTFHQFNFEGSVFWPPMSSLGIYAGVCFAAMPFVYLCLPETANKTSTEIGIEFTNYKLSWIRTKWGKQ